MRHYALHNIGGVSTWSWVRHTGLYTRPELSCHGELISYAMGGSDNNVVPARVEITKCARGHTSGELSRVLNLWRDFYLTDRELVSRLMSTHDILCPGPLTVKEQTYRPSNKKDFAFDAPGCTDGN